MSIQAIAVMSISISAVLMMISNDWKSYIYGLLISWAVIITDLLSHKQK